MICHLKAIGAGKLLVQFQFNPKGLRVKRGDGVNVSLSAEKTNALAHPVRQKQIISSFLYLSVYSLPLSSGRELEGGYLIFTEEQIRDSEVRSFHQYHSVLCVSDNFPYLSKIFLL